MTYSTCDNNSKNKDILKELKIKVTNIVTFNQ